MREHMESGGTNMMMKYSSKVVSAEQALSAVRPGDAIFVSAGSAVPQALVAALVSPSSATVDNEILHLLTLGDAPYTRPEFAGRFRHNALFIGANARDAVSDGRADYTPIFLSEIPVAMRSRRIRVDVALISVSRPDADGFCSFGTHVDITPAACDAARVVIAEMNARLPRTMGPCRIHVDRLHAIVESDRALPELPSRPARGETAAIARAIADLVPDGATLQLGIGGIPDAVLGFLADRKELGIHSEMFSDGVVDLIRRGVITGARKTLHRGKVVASFVLGSESTYRFLDQHPNIELHPSDYVNDPMVIASHDRLVAINTCLQLDLTGQVCSDSLGQTFYSGIGGQVDFIRGAARSRGGLPIIALPSTASGGVVSRIVPRLDDGAGVVTTRGDVHWIVTEFGAVNLHGLSVRERAMALISIAHPRFRPWLMAEAKQRRLVFLDQIEPAFRVNAYPRELENRVALAGGESIVVRPIRPTDESLMHQMFHDSSRDSRCQRFFATQKSIAHPTLQQFCTIDYERDMTLVAVAHQGETDAIVGWASFVRGAERSDAEAAFFVPDAWQGRGVGTQLMRRLAQIARERGVSGFRATVLTGNLRMLRVFEKCEQPMRTEIEGDVTHVRISFA